MSMFGKDHLLFYNDVLIIVTGSGKTDQLEQILVLSNSQIYRLQRIISFSWLIVIYSLSTTSLQNLML